MPAISKRPLSLTVLTACKFKVALMVAMAGVMWMPTSDARAVEAPARLERVVDGDTVIVRLKGRRFRVRIPSIDTAELNAKCRIERHRALAAKNYLRSLFSRSSRVTLVAQGHWQRDKFGRLLADIRLKNGGYVMALLLASGHARPWPHRNGRPTGPKPNWCA